MELPNKGNLPASGLNRHSVYFGAVSGHFCVDQDRNVTSAVGVGVAVPLPDSTDERSFSDDTGRQLDRVVCRT